MMFAAVALEPEYLAIFLRQIDAIAVAVGIQRRNRRGAAGRDHDVVDQRPTVGTALPQQRELVDVQVADTAGRG